MKLATQPSHVNKVNKARAISGSTPVTPEQLVARAQAQYTPRIQHLTQRISDIDRALRPSSTEPSSLVPKPQRKLKSVQRYEESLFPDTEPVSSEPAVVTSTAAYKSEKSLFSTKKSKDSSSRLDGRENFEHMLDRLIPQGTLRFIPTFSINTVRADSTGNVVKRKEMVTIPDPVTLTPLNRSDAMRRIIDKIFSYDYARDGGVLIKGDVSDVEVTILDPNNNPTEVIKVASKYTTSNCVMSVLNDDPNIEKVYDKLPHLRPVPNDPDVDAALAILIPEYKPTPANIMIDHEDLQQVATILRKHIVVYSKLGAIIDQPWKIFGTGKRKRVELVFGNTHANVRSKKVSVDNIVYVDEPSKIPHIDHSGRTDVVSYFENPTPQYAVTYDGDKHTMIKTFRPSSVTNDPADDIATKYAYSTTPDQVVSALFRKQYDIKTVNDPFIREITRLSEHFPPRRLFRRYTKRTLEVDRNAHFASYQNTEFYIGFPTHNLYPSVETPDSLFFVISDIQNAPEAFYCMHNYSSGQIVLPKPTVDFLRKYQTKLTVLYTLIGKTQHIDISEFAAQYSGGDKDLHKSLRNSIIGRSISGGVNETRKLSLTYTSDSERDQLIFEADSNGFKFDLYPATKQMTIHYKTRTNAAFHFHSFVLSYAFTALAEALTAMHPHFDIVGVNIDSILYENKRTAKLPLCVDNMPGNWKINAMYKQFFKKFQPQEYFTQHTLPQDILLFEATEPPQNIAIIGAPGIGKSYPFVSKPYYDQIVLSPTCALAKEHANTVMNLGADTVSITAEKYFQTMSTFDSWIQMRAKTLIPQRRSVVVIDECTMFTKTALDTMLHRAAYDGSFVILLFDPCQIMNETDKTPVTLEYIQSKFPIKTLTRSPDTPARQSYEFGSYLDTLRGKHPATQIASVSTYATIVDDDEIEFNQEYIHITSTHLRANAVNKRYREYYGDNGQQLIRVKQKKHGFSYLPVDHPQIWWDRTSMAQDLPKTYKYEPAFSTTSDSLQGSTFRSRMYIDANQMRHGTFYTAITRATTISNIFLVDI
jgi:hypothetical protein